MSRAGQIVGRWGETAAANHLRRCGYTVVERNARTQFGELDLIVTRTAESGDAELVFVEVKTRRSSSFGPPEISVSPRKQAHLLASAQAYLQANPHLPQAYRIDVIAVTARSGMSEPEIVHFENALTGG